MKLLVCGDVLGRLSQFHSRVTSVGAKAGPFDLVLCVGSFFWPSEDRDQKDVQLWEDLKSGKVTFPFPLYLLGPNSVGETQFFTDLGGYEIAENILYLGSQGCFTTKEGLTIAYLSGKELEKQNARQSHEFGFDEVKSLEVSMRWNDSKFKGVDILITSDWPAGVCSNTALQPKSSAPAGSKLISKVALNIKPRYHFVGMQRIHYERQPYRNHMVLNESAKHVTRFISLAQVGNKDKQKWLYAFNINPMKTMDNKELVAQPADVTDVPYKAGELQGLGASKQSQFFYDMNAPMEDKKKKRRRDDDDVNGFQKWKKQQAGPCWFCLSGSEVEKHLVVSIGTHTYLALPKGGLTNEHVLILPIAHYASSVECPSEVGEEVQRFKGALKKCFKKMGKQVVFFERNYKSQHLQLNAIPVPKDIPAEELKSAFIDIGASQQIEIMQVPEHASLTQMAPPGTPYFHVELPSKEELYHRVKSGFPIHFGREVLASKGILNLEDRIDWRECKAESKEEEANMTKEFRKMFEPFDFTLEDDDDE